MEFNFYHLIHTNSTISLTCVTGKCDLEDIWSMGFSIKNRSKLKSLSISLCVIH